MKFRSIACVATTLLLAVAPAAAANLSDASKAEILKLLDLVGFGDQVGEVQYVEMKTGEVLSIPFAADATVEYYFNVICDDDCGNVDMLVREADGTEIDVDDADDASPSLNIHESEYRSVLDDPKGTPRPVTIEIRMVDCHTDVCGLGLRIQQVV